MDAAPIHAGDRPEAEPRGRDPRPRDPLRPAPDQADDAQGLAGRDAPPERRSREPLLGAPPPVVQARPGRVARGHRPERRRQEHAPARAGRDPRADRGRDPHPRPRVDPADARGRLRDGADRARQHRPGRGVPRDRRRTRWTSWRRRSSSSPTSGQFIDAPVKTYSTGMRARLGFSIATAITPDILLLDEVLGTGDQTFRARSQARVRELVEQGQGDRARDPRPDLREPSSATGRSCSRRARSSRRASRTRSSTSIASGSPSSKLLAEEDAQRFVTGPEAEPAG